MGKTGKVEKNGDNKSEEKNWEKDGKKRENVGKKWEKRREN